VRVYISGHDQEHERDEFERAARELAEFGAEVSSPFHPDLTVPGGWTETRIEHVLSADAVVALPSYGMKSVDELLARVAGIPVRKLDEVLVGLQVA
jgi:hypothetical protein